MKCPDCDSKMIRINLKLTSYVGRFNYAYICERCEEDNRRKGGDKNVLSKTEKRKIRQNTINS